jgi:hypothetical protein
MQVPSYRLQDFCGRETAIAWNCHPPQPIMISASSVPAGGPVAGPQPVYA